jgi:hypothetical protein
MLRRLEPHPRRLRPVLELEPVGPTRWRLVLRQLPERAERLVANSSRYLSVDPRLVVIDLVPPTRCRMALAHRLHSSCRMVVRQQRLLLDCLHLTSCRKERQSSVRLLLRVPPPMNLLLVPGQAHPSRDSLRPAAYLEAAECLHL